MSDPAPRPGRPPRVLRILAAVFTVAAVGSLALLGLDLIVGRPAAGDAFIAFLNSLAAAALWRLSSATRRT